ncbi:MAG: nucleotide-binding protein [Candidatus Helarchaeota archaeon]
MKNLVIAIAGKGGTGKSVLSSLLIKKLRELKKYKILAIDADPTRGLSRVLGIENVSKTLEDIRNEIINVGASGDDAIKYELIKTLPMRVLEVLNEQDGFSVIAMGQPRTAGCFCPANTVLRNAIEYLLDKFDIIIIDCEAGLEQINRKVIQNINVLIIITDISKRGFETAREIKEMSLKFTKTEKIGLVINRVKKKFDYVIDSAKKLGLEIFGFIPEDENVSEFDMIGKSLLELPDNSQCMEEINKILQKIGCI